MPPPFTDISACHGHQEEAQWGKQWYPPGDSGPEVTTEQGGAETPRPGNPPPPPSTANAELHGDPGIATKN